MIKKSNSMYAVTIAYKENSSPYLNLVVVVEQMTVSGRWLWTGCKTPTGPVETA